MPSATMLRRVHRWVQGVPPGWEGDFYAHPNNQADSAATSATRPNS